MVLGTLFFTWLYTAPFALIVGLIRRTTRLNWMSVADAAAQGRVTDVWLRAGLIIAITVPLAGVALAGVLRDRVWTRRYAIAVGGGFLMLLGFAMVGSLATGPLIGHYPGPPRPAPAVTQCIPRSGGHGCPGG